MMSVIWNRRNSGKKSDPASNGVHVWPGVGSLHLLVDATKPGEIKTDVVKSWQRVNGQIQNSYFDRRKQNACVVITQVHSRLSLRARRQVLVWSGDHNVALRVRAFDNALTRAVLLARSTERGTDHLLPRRNRKVVANLIFTVVVPLIRVLSVVASEYENKPLDEDATEMLQSAASTAEERLNEIDKYVAGVELQTAVRYYLYGLPMGFVVIIPLVMWFGRVWEAVGADPDRFLAVAVTGGLGSITSVMMRITRGHNLTVNPRQGPAVTVVSGAFRTLVGAVFGITLYLLVQGELLPLQVPIGNASLWFAGLAFLAGFSERWAQDTIMMSTPIATAAKTPHAAEAPGKDDEQKQK